MVISLPMKSVIRVIVLWLMLVALPFQGFASASMLLCGAAKPAVQADAGSGHHDHAAMQAAAQHDSDNSSDCASGSHGCAMSDCCVGAALAYALPQAASHPQRAQRLYLPESVPPPPVDLALPKRPPRAIPA
jgi:hypothetical protein